jgi:3-phosphoshikimate 1-carboxyvinyltransferase
LKVKITGPQSLHGTINAPKSKSYTHRALIASFLSEGESIIDHPLECQDTERTQRAIQKLGANVRLQNDRIFIEGHGEPSWKIPFEVDCGDSGTTFRFLTALAAISPTGIMLRGSASLAKRPHAPLLKALEKLGASTITGPDQFVIGVKGPLKGGETSLPGDVSSQFLSGLLFASPFAQSDVTIHIKNRLESSPYVKMSLSVLEKHGIKILQEEDETYHIPAPQTYRPVTHQVPADFSSTSFLIAATGIAGDKVRINELNINPNDPDAIIMKIVDEIGINAQYESDNLILRRNVLHPFNIDATDYPDLVPVLQVLACFANGESEIRGVKRLQFKETNRLETVPTELRKMGAKIEINNDTIRIEGSEKLTGSIIDSHNDHRVAMACSIASLAATGSSIIDQAEAVSKSYPEFFTDLSRLGVRFDVE